MSLPPVVEGQQPANKCNEDVYAKGSLVFMTHTIRSWHIENWVRKVAERSGQPVDWHFVAGRACVKALGDLDKVREALAHFKPEHDKLYLEAHESSKELLGYTDDQIMRGCTQLSHPDGHY